jgi:hypothetical protein
VLFGIVIEFPVRRYVCSIVMEEFCLARLEYIFLECGDFDT